METAARRRGATLTDLIATLGIAGILLGMAVPRLSAARDGRAAAAARDAAAALIARARTLAVAQGTAAVIIDPAIAVVTVEAPAGSPAGDPLRLGDAFGVTLSVDQSAASVRLDFDALGTGRLVNRTIRFRRGQAEARLSLSSYGRPRRW